MEEFLTKNPKKLIGLDYFEVYKKGKFLGFLTYSNYIKWVTIQKK